MNCIKCSAPLPEGALFCPMCGKKQTAVKRRRRKRTNGSGSISKLSGNRAKPYLARKGDVVVGTYATVGEAEKALARLVDRDVGNLFNLTTQEVYDSWRPEHEALLREKAIDRTGSERSTSMDSYTAAWTHCTDLADQTFRALRVPQLQAVLDSMRDAGLSRSSIQKVQTLLSLLYQWAMREAIVTTNYAQFLVVSGKRTKPKEVFTDEEIRLLQSCKEPAAAVTLILIGSGARINELFQLRTADCTDDYFVSGTKTPAGVMRAIPVSPIGLDSYRKLLSCAREKDLPRLIDAYEGNRDAANWRKRDYAPMLERLGIPYRVPHYARHTFATKAIASDMRKEDLTKILGHSNYSVTVNTYDNPSTAALVDAAKVVDV